MDSAGHPLHHNSSVQILFLDFDGVLHPEFCHESKHFVHREIFEAVIRIFPTIDIVISSTWRLKRSLTALQALFSEDVAGRIVGATPAYSELEDVPESLVGYERESECNAWLKQNNRNAQTWLALDDRSWNFRPFNRNVFLLDGRTGLIAESADELIKRLTKKD